MDEKEKQSAVAPMTGLERLKRLIVVLENVRDDPAKAREFNLGAWAEEVPGCGTHYCACGWGAVDPVLKAQGLGLERMKRPSKEFYLTYDSRSYGAAAQAFFDIDEDTSDLFFMPASYDNHTSIQPVIDRIRKYVAERDRTDSVSTDPEAHSNA